MSTLHERFAAALLDPARAAPPEIGRAGRRFAVYRNNLRVSLSDGLVARFPLCHALVGDAFFRAMAGRFIEACPPRSPVLATWGDALPAFIEVFPPLSALPYLADCARLEVLRTEAYHAADAIPLDAADLAAIPAGTWDAMRLSLHPSVRLLASPHPVASLWQMHAGSGGSGIAWDPEEVLVARAGDAVEVTRLPKGGVAFLTALRDLSVGAATHRIGLAEADFDLTACLTAAIHQRILVGRLPTQRPPDITWATGSFSGSRRFAHPASAPH